jgi:hypothetical protein
VRILSKGCEIELLKLGAIQQKTCPEFWKAANEKKKFKIRGG